MGIKGIYEEIGHGRRVALSKLAVEKFEEAGRPLRVAVDLSIWQFQTQSGKGGTNPALRTFYYRLLKLLSLSIQPLFVFDGPQRPAFKRNRRVATGSNSVLNLPTKRLLDLFGFPHYVAPGEAEAECALLQRTGIVDAVLSEDVDALMFGCGVSLRNWSSEGSRGSKSPTHVSVYDARDIVSGPAKLAKEGIILVAMMSGGDYNPEGIPGCGVKVACEAARAGFGKSLCETLSDDAVALLKWKDELLHELHTNEARFFRTKHRAIRIPDDFPNPKLLHFYTDPKTSSVEQARSRQITWDRPVDLQGLREYVAEAFEWRRVSGAKKFVRGLAPALLIQQLRLRGQRDEHPPVRIESTHRPESALVQSLLGRPELPRRHFSTDGMDELRVAFVPLDIVPLDLGAEEADSEPDEAPSASDEDFVQGSDQELELKAPTKSPSKRKLQPKYDPSLTEKMWILKTWVKIGVPSLFREWTEPARDPFERVAQKEGQKRATTSRRPAKGRVVHGMAGAMDRYVKITKPVSKGDRYPTSKLLQPPAQSMEKAKETQRFDAPDKSAVEVRGRKSRPADPPTNRPDLPIYLSSDEELEEEAAAGDGAIKPTNPWTLSRRPSDTFGLQPNAEYPALGILKGASKSSKTSAGPRESLQKGRDLYSSNPGGLVSPPVTPAAKRSKENRKPKTKSSPSSSRMTRSYERDHEDSCEKTWYGSSPPMPGLDNEQTSDNRISKSKGYAETQAITLSSSPGLPSPLDPLSPSQNPRRVTTHLDTPQPAGESPELGPESVHISVKGHLKKSGRLFALRSSLEGTWKEVDELEAHARRHVWREEDIDQVDLASD
ncbi:MAG: hypothetical protein M4579_000933 [Chaenotheca gracillima]|nr:MAG: hypothetical protein M4579_000933 [Chaenotheca gracillima]